MNPKALKRGRAIAFLLLLLPAAACSLIANTKGDQCSSDADCKKLSQTAVCQSGVCVDNSLSGADGGPGLTDGGSGVGEGGKLPDGGCIPKVPVSQSDYLNEKCTNSSCIPFDNCARIGVCDGSLPPLIVPDGGF